MNNIFIISGCQRSGTTLLSLMLSVHDEIVLIDETDFNPAYWERYQNDPVFGPNLVIKLPAQSHRLSYFVNTYACRLIWIDRSPLDVIYSMIQLKLPLVLRKRKWFQLFTKPNYIKTLFPPTLEFSWVNHIYGGKIELEFLKNMEELKHLHTSLDSQYLKTIKNHPEVKSELFGAKIYLLKKEIKKLLLKTNVNDLHILKYEELINSPKKEIQKVLDFIGVTFSEKVLQHHLYLSGTSIGDTKNDEPIIKNNKNKYLDEWSKNKISLINQFLDAYE